MVTVAFRTTDRVTAESGTYAYPSQNLLIYLTNRPLQNARHQLATFNAKGFLPGLSGANSSFYL
jgi:hypothetical protein